MLFELISARYERRSLLITANQPFGEWGKIFPDPAMTLAAVDRLVHHATIFEMNVESYRRRTALDRKNRPGTAANYATPKNVGYCRPATINRKRALANDKQQRHYLPPRHRLHPDCRATPSRSSRYNAPTNVQRRCMERSLERAWRLRWERSLAKRLGMVAELLQECLASHRRVNAFHRLPECEASRYYWYRSVWAEYRQAKCSFRIRPHCYDGPAGCDSVASLPRQAEVSAANWIDSAVRLRNRARRLRTSVLRISKYRASESVPAHQGGPGADSLLPMMSGAMLIQETE